MVTINVLIYYNTIDYNISSSSPAATCPPLCLQVAHLYVTPVAIVAAILRAQGMQQRRARLITRFCELYAFIQQRGTHECHVLNVTMFIAFVVTTNMSATCCTVNKVLITLCTI